MADAPFSPVVKTRIPLFGDINADRFTNAVIAGVLGGAGISAAANLLRSYRELRNARKEETDDNTIVLNLPSKTASDGYTGMKEAKPGETKITANGGRQSRESGKYGKGLGNKPDIGPSVKCALTAPTTSVDTGRDIGPNSVGTIIANTLGITAGGIMAYDVVSRLFDAMNERRLKRKLEAAQQAYVGALSGSSKRAEAVLSVLDPVEHVIAKNGIEKDAGIGDALMGAFNWVSDRVPGANVVRYPVALYVLSLLAGTGASAYVTKKIMDREFPEEKIKKDINRPTRIVFRMADSGPSLLEGNKGEEKAASDETCAALSAILPIYQDIVEGRPNRTLAEPYVKFAEAIGTDADGLMKMAKFDMMQVIMTLLRNPRALWNILRGTRFGLDFTKQKAVNILRSQSPDVYKTLTDAAISDHFDQPGLWNNIKKTTAQGIANFGGRDWMVDQKMQGKSDWEMAKDLVRRGAWKFIGGTPSQSITGTTYPSPVVAQKTYVQPSVSAPQMAKPAEADTFLHSSYLGDVVFGGDKPDDDEKTTVDEKDVITRVRRAMKGRRGITVSATDPAAAVYVRKNKATIKKLIARLNASGSI